MVSLFLVLFIIPWTCQAQNLAEKPVNEADNAQTEKTIVAKIYKKIDTYEIEALELTFGQSRYYIGYALFKDKFFNGKIVSFSDKTLGYFGILESFAPKLCVDRTEEGDQLQGGCFNYPEGEFFVRLPYFPNGKYADIYDPFGEKVLTIDLSSKATCNENGVCDQPIEDSENCPQDCQKGEPKLDPILVKKAQEATDKSKKGSLSDFSWRWLVIIFIMLLSGGAIGYYVYRRNKELSDY